MMVMDTISDHQHHHIKTVGRVLLLYTAGQLPALERDPDVSPSAENDHAAARACLAFAKSTGIKVSSSTSLQVILS
jgi:hypothetical protein